MKRFSSAQRAIDAKCKDCIYDELVPGTWRNQVTLCPAKTCELWDFRPLDKHAKADVKASKIAAMTDEQYAAYKVKQEQARLRLAKN